MNCAQFVISYWVIGDGSKVEQTCRRRRRRRLWQIAQDPLDKVLSFSDSLSLSLSGSTRLNTLAETLRFLD